MTWFQLILPVPSRNVTKNLTGHRMHLKDPQIYQMNQLIAFRICVTCYRQRWTVRSILCTSQNRLFCVHESLLPDFGRPWTANGWNQVNFRPTPENLGVGRLKLVMWEVDGIKVERTQGRYIFYVCARKLATKRFFDKTLRTQKFSAGKFFRASTESLRTQDSVAWKRIEHGFPILESMFYSFPSDRTKIGGVTLISDITICRGQILKHPLPPLPYIFWTVWT